MVEDRAGTSALAGPGDHIEEERMPAATPAAAGSRRRGPRPRHTRQDVALAAVAIADADGIDKVTFRAVAARLGVGVMSLYNYVPDKQALVYDMVGEVSAELRLPELTGDWRADVHRLASRRSAREDEVQIGRAHV